MGKQKWRVQITVNLPGYKEVELSAGTVCAGTLLKATRKAYPKLTSIVATCVPVKQRKARK